MQHIFMRSQNNICLDTTCTFSFTQIDNLTSAVMFFQAAPALLAVVNNDFMGKMFQAAQLTHERFLTIDHYLISAKLNFHQPLVCSTKRNIQYYTPEVRGSSVWQKSKKYFAGVIYGQKSFMCQLWQLETFSPYIH